MNIKFNIDYDTFYTGNVNIEYFCFGSGNPLIVYNGSNISKRMCKCLVEKYSDKYTLYVINRILDKNGKKIKYRNNANLFSEEIINFIRISGFTRINLYGINNGTSIIFKIARQYPKLVPKLALIKPVIGNKANDIMKDYLNNILREENSIKYNEKIVFESQVDDEVKALWVMDKCDCYYVLKENNIVEYLLKRIFDRLYNINCFGMLSRQLREDYIFDFLCDGME